MVHRAIPATLLAALLAALVLPAAQAASPGARGAITVDNAVSEVAMAGDGRFAAAMNDPGSVVMGNPDLPVWDLWNLDGSLRAAGSADPTSCPSPSTANPPQPAEDCQTPATHIALSNDGKRLVVASVVSTDNNLVSIFSDSGNRATKTISVAGTVTDVAISDDGNHVAYSASIPAPAGSTQRTGLVQVVDGNGLNPTFGGNGATYPKPATDVQLTPDGQTLVVAAGAHIYYPTLGGTPRTHAISGTDAVDLDVSADDGWTIAGFSNGFFGLYHQPSPADKVTYQKKEAGETTSLDAVAIRRDATAFATGSAGGTLRLYGLDTGAVTATLVATKTGLGPIHEARFSGDGRYLVVQSGSDSLRMYRATSSGLDELWHDTHASLGTSLGIDTRGEHVVAHTTDGTHAVLVYDAVHKLTAILPSAAQQPGTTANDTVTFRNDGNRAEDVTLSASPPAGVSASVNPSQFSVAPGASQAVTVTVTLPATRAPGPATIALAGALGAGGIDGSSSANLVVTVPTVRNLRLDPSGATSVGVDQGGVAVFQVQARNAGNVVESGGLHVDNVPDGWTGTVSPTSINLNPGSFSNLTVTLTPPTGAAKGSHADVTLARDGGGSLELIATVGAVFGVQLQAPAGVLLQPEMSGLLNLTVRNVGNAPDTLVVRLGNLPAGWQAAFLTGLTEDRVEDVQPGASATVQATIRPPAGSDTGVPVQLNVVSSSLGDATKTSSKLVLLTVESPSGSSSSASTAAGHKSPAPVGPLVALGLVGLAAVLRRRS